MKINIVGLGSGSLSSISYGAYNVIKQSQNLFFRTLSHPIINKLGLRKDDYESFDFLYETKNNFEEVYQSIVNILILKVQQLGEITYAVPGNPKVAEKTVEYLFEDERIKKMNIELEIVASASFLEEMFIYLNVDPIKNNLTILDALNFKNEHLRSKTDILFTQVYSKHIASELKLKLGKYFKDEAEVIIFKGAGIKDIEQKIKVAISDIDRCNFDFDHLSSIFISYDEKNYKYRTIYDLADIVAYLRGENGCPWDKAQTSLTLIGNMREELEELIEAIEKDDIENIIEEIGDVLMLLVMQTRLAEEEYLFDLDEVIEKVCSKLIFRHPHVFGDEIAQNIDDVDAIWKKQKEMENDKFI